MLVVTPRTALVNLEQVRLEQPFSVDDSEGPCRPVREGPGHRRQRCELDLPDLAGRTILVVDDNDDALDMLGTFLRACGAYVLQARSGTGALAYIDTQPLIDAMITDLSMPGMDGLELVRRLRRHPSRSAIPAIALTGFYESYMDTQAVGFSAFLRKPVNFDALCKTIIDAIEKGD